MNATYSHTHVPYLNLYEEDDEKRSHNSGSSRSSVGSPPRQPALTNKEDAVEALGALSALVRSYGLLQVFFGSETPECIKVMPLAELEQRLYGIFSSSQLLHHEGGVFKTYCANNMVTCDECITRETKRELKEHAAASFIADEGNDGESDLTRRPWTGWANRFGRGILDYDPGQIYAQ